MGVEEKRPSLEFFEPFPSERIEAFIRCFGSEAEEEYFSTRDPYLTAQQLMFCLYFWSKETEEFFQAKLERLRECLELTPEQIGERLSARGSREEAIAKTKRRFSESLGRILDWEAKLEKGNSRYPKQDPLRKIYEMEKGEISFEEWQAGYLFGLFQYYKETTARERIYDLTGKYWTTPVPLKEEFYEQFWPSKSYFSNPDKGRNFRIYEPYGKPLDFIEGRVLVHGVAGLTLKLQIFSGALGDFSTTNCVSFSRDRVFVPAPRIFLSDPQKWALFFDPQEIQKAGLAFIVGGEATEEKEVKILPPIDLSLCLGAFPLESIEKLGWEKVRAFPYPNQKLLIIPENYKNAGEVCKILKERLISCR